MLKRAVARSSGATVFAYRVEDLDRYGVIEMGADGRGLSIEEKPVKPKSHMAVTGLYFYDNDVVRMAASLKPSARGELEITDINRLYLERGDLHVETMSRGYAWLDSGTHDSLLETSEFVRTIQKRQGIQIACLKEIPYQNGFIDRAMLLHHTEAFGKSDHGRHLANLAHA